MSYRLKLLGPFAIEPLQDGAPVGTLNRKTRALLAYLATTGKPCTRQALSAWFCQDARDPAGTLRWHLSQIRRQVSPTVLTATRHTATANLNHLQCDNRQFAAAINSLPDIPTELLATAVASYRGPFLAGLSLKNAPEFELWQVGERSRLQQLYEKGATALLTRHIAQSRHDEAIALARTLLQSNPLLETIHLYLAWLYAQSGQRQAALQQVAQCQELLMQELAVEPTAALRRLHRAIVHNQPLPNVVSTAPATVAAPAAAPAPFIGRSRELARLAGLWPNGRAVVLIEGAAGGGKTRLVQEWIHQLPAAPSLVGRCYETTRAIPYHPWQTVLQEQLRHLDPDALARLAPYWRQQLGLLLPALGETAVSPNQEQLFRAVVHLLTDINQAPRLIFLDDVQWADEASLQLFQFVAQQLDHTAAPAVLIAAFRSEEAVDNPTLLTLLSDMARLPHTVRLSLAPFSEMETEQLIATLWQELPAGFRTPHVRDRLLQATGGNPLYMTEILEELTLATALPGDLPLPPSLAALIERRLAQLPAHGRQVMESLAVLDQPAPFALAQQVSARSEEETLTAVDRGLRWRLLRLHTENRIDFSHDLMRTAVLQQINPIRRQRLHQRAAQALAQTNAEAATLAYHWAQAGDRHQAGHYAVIAAAKAAQLYAIDDAIAFYRQAIAYLPDTEERLAALRQLGRLYLRISDWASAHEILSAGLAAAQAETAVAAQFQILLGQLHSRQSHYRRALDVLHKAYQVCQTINAAELLAQCVGTMGIVYYFLDDYDKSLACYAEALATAQAQRDEENVAVWLSNMATIHLKMGAHEQALPHLQQAVAVQKRLGNQEQTAVALGNLGNVYRQAGDYVQAAAHHREAAQIRQEWGDRAGVATNLRDLGINYADVGQTEAALACFWQALTLDVALARRDACGEIVGYIGQLLARQGEETAAMKALALAAGLLRLAHSRLHLSRVLLARITLLWSQSDWPHVATLLKEATEAAAASKQADLLLRCRVTAVRLQAAQQTITLQAAIAALAALQTDSKAQKATVGYAIWQIDPTQEQWRQETAECYRQLYMDVPLYIYRQRFADLGGRYLPAPPALPAPPTLVSPLAVGLSLYLEKLNTLLSD